MPVKAKRRGRPPIIRTNSLKAHLQGYSSPGHALAALPELGHIVTGAVNLDYGKNANPLGMKTALVLLRHLDVISTETILEYMELSLRECCERHAQRLAQCLRIIERATRTAKAQWPEPDERQSSDAHATVHNIVPCSEQGCPVCRWPAAVEHAWDLTAAEKDELTNPSATIGFGASDEDELLDPQDDLCSSD